MSLDVIVGLVVGIDLRDVTLNLVLVLELVVLLQVADVVRQSLALLLVAGTRALPRHASRRL
jgi:hypothetical protein